MHFAISQDLRAVFAGRQKADGSPFVALEKNPHPDPFARSRLQGYNENGFFRKGKCKFGITGWDRLYGTHSSHA